MAEATITHRKALDTEKRCEICNHEIHWQKMSILPDHVFLCGLCNVWMCKSCIRAIPSHYVKENKICCFKCFKKHHKWCQTCKFLGEFNI